MGHWFREAKDRPYAVEVPDVVRKLNGWVVAMVAMLGMCFFLGGKVERYVMYYNSAFVNIDPITWYT